MDGYASEQKINVLVPISSQEKPLLASLNDNMETIKKMGAIHFKDVSLLKYHAVHSGILVHNTNTLHPSANIRSNPLILIPPIGPSFLPGNESILEWMNRIAGPPPGIYPSFDQGKASCLDAARVFKYFATECQKSKKLLWRLKATDVECLRDALEVFNIKKPESIREGGIQIFPYEEYSCALVARADHILVRLELVCLDGWRFDPHVDSSGETIQLAVPTLSETVVLPIGHVLKTKYESFCRATDTLLENIKKSSGNERNSEQKKHGHKKTPGMIQSLLRQALNKQDGKKEVEQPRGGFTDVGRHTGCHPRSVAFPLACAVILHQLERRGNSVLFWRVLSHIHVSLAEACVYELVTEREQRKILPTQNLLALLDSSMQTMRATSGIWEDNLKIDSTFEEMQLFSARVVTLRHLLMIENHARAEQVSTMYQLPLLQNISNHLRNLNVELNTEISATTGFFNREKILQAVDLQDEKFLSSSSMAADWHSIRTWMKNHRSKSFIHQLHLCRFVEERVYTIAIKGFGEKSLATIKTIDAIVATYRDVLQIVLSDPKVTHLMKSELKSREVLLVWITLCAIHRSVSVLEPSISGYAIPLRASALKNLVISGNHARQALLSVADYLETHRSGAPIFSLLKNDVTIQFAEQYASKCDRLSEIWSKEHTLAEQRKRKRWDTVQRKQNELATLDAIFFRDTRRKEKVEAEIENIKPFQQYPLRYYTGDMERRNTLQQELTGLSENIRVTKTKISEVERAPTPIFQPLPRYKHIANAVLFFLWIPDSLEILSRMSFVAQQLILPKENNLNFTISPTSDLEEIISFSDAPKVTWYEYYSSRSTERWYKAMKTRVCIGSDYNSVPLNKWYPTNVRHQSNSEEGIYYPNSLEKKLFWVLESLEIRASKNKEYFDPFQQLSAYVYTHTLTDNCGGDKLRWALLQNGNEISNCRSNDGIASQNMLPSGMTRTEYAHFTSLRSYPHIQFRSLCSFLNDNELKMSSQNVATLIRQTLYQVGDVSARDLKKFKWMQDANFCEGWTFLRNILLERLDILRCKVRDHKTLPLYGEIAAFASQWDEECGNIARQFAATARLWADDLDQVEENCEVKGIAELRARRCLFYLYSITCFVRCGNVRDAQEMCDCLLLADYYRLFNETSSLKTEIQIFSTKAVARSFLWQEELMVLINHNPMILTNAVRRIINSTPAELDWNQSCDSDGSMHRTSFSALSNEGHHYFVDIMSGHLLYDGKPLSRLPSTITRNQLYCQTFGNRNFEVVTNTDGSFSTVRDIDGRFYEFSSSSDHVNLKITEKETAHSSAQETLELLPYYFAENTTQHAKAQHAKDLPIRIRALYSHWLCRARNVIVCRRFEYNLRDILFLLVQDEGDSGDWVCYKISNHVTALNWRALLQRRNSFDVILRPRDDKLDVLIKVLSKFESTEGCIEICQKVNKTVVLQLFRFGLEFTFSGNGTLWSSNYKGYRLSDNQSPPHILQNFRSYLFLEKADERKILIPSGSVMKENGNVEIGVVKSCSAKRQYYVYDIHRRFETLDIQNGKNALEGRLQLAAIHAATDSLLPDMNSFRTGGESAMHLLRQCWSSKPFSKSEVEHMHEIICFGYRVPALSLLCFELNNSANSLSFLSDTKSDIILDDGAAIRYVHEKRARKLSPLQILSDDEERVVFGKEISIYAPVLEQVPAVSYNFEAPVETERSIRESLGTFLNYRYRSGNKRKFPLSVTGRTGTVLETELSNELCDSWDAYISLPIPSLVASATVMKEKIDDLFLICTLERKKLEVCLSHFFSSFPVCCHYSESLILRRSLNFQPTVHVRDISMCARDITLVSRFNPFISVNSLELLREEILRWLSLCVLEDKLERLQHYAKNDSTTELIRELKEKKREWSVKEHPHWLLFEVEQRIEVRGVQYQTTKFCLNNNNCATQVNMGEGKTRVILPLLIMEVAQKNHFVRLNFLSPLLSEAYEYLHGCITGSLFPQRFCLFPFSREISMDIDQATAIHRFFKRLQKASGVLCVAPEHVLSFQLKWHELRMNNTDKSQGVREILSSIYTMPYFDIFDEIDALLSHKYQLIYAVGKCILLPAGKERWIAAQSVLKQVQGNDEVLKVLRKVAKYPRIEKTHSGSFSEVRLQTSDELLEVRTEFYEAISKGIISSPPYHFRRLAELPCQAALIKFITDPGKKLDSLVKQVGDFEIPQSEKNMLLALRGTLACGLLEHCLARRHRVEFGVDDRRGFLHRVAVPYRASDTPSDRAEYAHPDTLILFTHLAYYYKGLSRSEMKEAVVELLKLGPIEQQEQYFLWLSTSRPSMSTEYLHILDSVSKLDVESTTQLDILHRTFRLNMEAINFWLDACVLPRETMQFPQRLSGNAFNLADNNNGKTVGFSGTKDNKLLLPTQIKQRIPDNADVRATDGKMLQLILSNDRVLSMGREEPLNLKVLKTAVDEKLNAVIDAGASMAGLSNSKVAERIVKLLNCSDWKDCKGVVYYSPESATWRVRNLEGMEWPMGNSPIHERDTIVYFDESRCRGADMKLLDNATGLITIGPGMCKDKLMQAAGRMRKLDRGQRLVFAVPFELVHLICFDESAKLNCKSLMEWVIRNTAKAITDGLPGWAVQGIQFCTTRDPAARIMDEIIGLEDLYANSIDQKPISQQVIETERYYRNRLYERGIEMRHQDEKISTEILSTAERVGKDWYSTARSMEEECEREVEHERETERETERQVEGAIPLQDTGLGGLSLGKIKSIGDLKGNGHPLLHIADAMKKYFTRSKLHEISWQKTSIFVTENFILTVLQEGKSCVSEYGGYLRPVGLSVVFPEEGSLLLLSEHEADDAIVQGWNLSGNATQSVSWVLVSVPFLFRADTNPRDISTWPLRVPLKGHFETKKVTAELSEETMAGLQLFCGSTMYGSQSRIEGLRNLLQSQESIQAAFTIVKLRGKGTMISRSELESVCSQLG